MLTCSLTLMSSKMISAYVKHFCFRIPESFQFLPGQFITLYFEVDGRSFHRSYSIASPPNQACFIEIAAGLVPQGVGSAYLDQLKPGDEVVCKGPFGRLILKEPFAKKRLILIGTSTGVTPYRSMIPALQQACSNRKLARVVFLQGVQYRKDALYQDDFLACTEENILEYRLCLSRETSTTMPYEHLGRVQTYLPTLALNPLEDSVYLCGHPQMVDETYQVLQQLGFEHSSLIREKYGSRSI